MLDWIRNVLYEAGFLEMFPVTFFRAVARMTDLMASIGYKEMNQSVSM